jgi:hypothetical protein
MAKNALLAAYEALAELGQAQRQALQDPELDAFLALAERRDELFKQVQVLEPEGDRASELERRQIQGAIAEILETDRQIQHELLIRTHRTRTELGKIQPGMNALQAYLQDADASAYFIDRNS